MDRRAFLASVGAAWVVDAVLPTKPPVSGAIVGASAASGHALRDPAVLAKAPARTETCDVVIAGGGVSGLAAAWRLRALGLDALVLELEPDVGGTSRGGHEGASPHPWGAHYLAAPNPEARATLRLLEQMGTLTKWDLAGRPVFDPRVLCHAPQERIFYRGAWHKGLVPVDELDEPEERELARFHEIEAELTTRRGRDGKLAFNIPLEHSSRDPELLALDEISMATWMSRNGFTAAFVNWYVRYAMLDDFGGAPEDVSAWAGLNYFCARKLRTPELEGSHYLVWPEGNGRLVRALRDLGTPRVTTGALAHAIESTREGAEVTYLDLARGENVRVRARAAVLATPGFIGRRLVPGAAGAFPARASSPWLVANLHVRWPFEADRAWDSVLYEAEGLGYVDARHQLTDPRDGTVLTYYRAFGEPDVAATRGKLLKQAWSQLADGVLTDLAPAHPRLRESLERLDVMIWGHGMPRPRPGFLGPRPFEAQVELAPRVFWGHVDQTGIALFEEAQLRGVRAAEAAARAAGVEISESWT